jgi:GT2 family glycosyltransferase
LRHIFGWLGDSIKYAPALAQPLGLLNRCYRALGDKIMADRCAEEARRCFTPASTCDLKRSRGSSPGQFQFSLIVPTYNRLPILKKCMAALERQTVSAGKFEVIVIDDGSTDGTEDFMRGYSPAFQLRYLRQPNSGTGAARRHGVRHATGEYLLLMNDDTICDPNLLEEHLRAQQVYSGYQWAVLGDFEYPAEARHRALTHFFRANPFMFPQVDMSPGCPYGYSHFITCNLSIRREAIVEAGSFDPTYKLSEDTEMGIRLFEKGYGVIYHPAAHAWHDHLPYPAKSLIRRARVYGADYFYMFRNHPRVTREWAMPVRLQEMNEADATCIRAYLERNRGDVEAAVTALERWDSVEFEPILENPAEARHVLSLFQQAVPAIHWFYLYESMLATMVKELSISQVELPPPLALSATQGS